MSYAWQNALSTWRTPLRAELLRASLLVSMANAPFWLLSAHYAMARPWVNLDVILPLLLAVWLPAAGIALMIGVWGLDLLQSMSLAYHFGSPWEFARSAQFAPHVDWLGFLSLEPALTLTGFAAIGFGLWRWTAYRHPNVAALLIVAALICVLDAANGSSPTFGWGSDRFRVPANISGSPSYNLVHARWEASVAAGRPVQRWPTEDLNTIESWATSRGGNILVVVVESLGVHRSEAIRSWLTKQLLGEAVPTRWQIRQEAVPFKGSTTAGELRSLCALSMHYSRLTDELASGCLPRRLKSKGYATFGLHGFTGHMFERYGWWPLIGIDNTAFEGDFGPRPPRCGGAFRGLCDAFLIDEGFRLLGGQSRFVYVLTLNTHMPVMAAVVPPDLRALCDADGAGESVCQLVALHGALFAHLRHKLEGVTGPLPLVHIVGDHAPPFISQDERRQFSPMTVQRIILTPRHSSVGVQSSHLERR